MKRGKIGFDRLHETRGRVNSSPGVVPGSGVLDAWWVTPDRVLVPDPVPGHNGGSELYPAVKPLSENGTLALLPAGSCTDSVSC